MALCLTPKNSEGNVLVKIKLAVLGDIHVGKTSLISKYVSGLFSHTYLSTQGGDLFEKSLVINEIKVNVTIIDSAGNEFVRSLIKTLYRDVHGILLVFDVTREETFNSLGEWLRQIKLVNPNNPNIILVGNKNDVEGHKKVETMQAAMYAARNCLPYIEVSAKSGHEVDDIFNTLIKETFIQKIKTHDNSTQGIQLIDPVQEEKAKGGFEGQCCS